MVGCAGATLFIDVRDLWTKAGKRGSDDILLGRCQRSGAKVARVLDPGANPLTGVRYFDCYGPTILAVNETIVEPMASRCLIITPPQASGRWPNLGPEDGLELRERLVALRAKSYDIPLPEVDKPADGRLGDILQPLGQVAAMVGDDVYKEFLDAAERFRQERQSERSQTTTAKLIEAVVSACVKEQLDEGKGPVTIKSIKDLYNDGLPERQQLTNEQVGKRLGALGFPAGPRSSTERTREIDLRLLDELAVKFAVKDPEEPVTPVTPDTNIETASQTGNQPVTDLSPPVTSDPSTRHAPVTPQEQDHYQLPGNSVPGVTGVTGDPAPSADHCPRCLKQDTRKVNDAGGYECSFCGTPMPDE